MSVPGTSWQQSVVLLQRNRSPSVRAPYRSITRENTVCTSTPHQRSPKTEDRTSRERYARESSHLKGDRERAAREELHPQRGDTSSERPMPGIRGSLDGEGECNERAGRRALTARLPASVELEGGAVSPLVPHRVAYPRQEEGVEFMITTRAQTDTAIKSLLRIDRTPAQRHSRLPERCSRELSLSPQARPLTMATSAAGCRPDDAATSDALPVR